MENLVDVHWNWRSRYVDDTMLVHGHMCYNVRVNMQAMMTELL